jgi:hypothetical protein
MKGITKIVITTALLTATPLFGSTQYFQSLFDIDSSADFGVDIFQLSNGNLFVRGTSLPKHRYEWNLFNTQISSDGSTLISNKILALDGVSLHLGYPGETKILPDGGFISPFNEQTYYLKSLAGLVKYSPSGDTVFTKTYSDSNLYSDAMLSCAITTDGGYLIGGRHKLNASTSPWAPGLIIRTDSLGDTLWTRTYWKDTNTSVQINSIVPLADGRIVVGAWSSTIKTTSLDWYYCDAPWYMLLDNMGNIIRDTVYSHGFQCCGFIYKDVSGGYGTIGGFDSVYNPDPASIENFPSFAAHLDTNFRITWITDFPYSSEDGHREKWNLKQLHDSSYIIVGDKWTDTLPGNFGWAAKLDRNGNLIWNKYYQSDTAYSSYLRGMVEKPDGSLVFVGTSFNDTLPTWHNQEDLWLVGTDSNGCDNAWCSPVEVKPSPVIPKDELLLYPNPTAGSFTVNTPMGGKLILYTMLGQQIAAYNITDWQTELQMPSGISGGIYLCRFKSNDAVMIKEARLVYQP